MQFGLYLIRRGLIDAEQFVAALQQQHQDLPALGQLAIEQGVLSARDVFKVLRVQSDFGGERFGQTALDLDLLDRDELAELLLLQSDRKRSIGEVLVDLGAIDQETCDQELEAYRREQEQGEKRESAQVTRTAIPWPATAEVAST